MQIPTRIYAELSNIGIPADLVDAVSLAKADATKVERAIETNQKTMAGLTEKEIDEDAIKSLIAGKGDLSKTLADKLKHDKKIEAQKAALQEIEGALKGELEKQQRAVAEAEAAVDAYLDQQLELDRRTRIEQLLKAKEERGRDMGNTRTYPKSTPPERQARSSVACCEHCSEPVAVVDLEAITTPVTGADFRPLPRSDTVFPPCDWLNLVCPVCRRRRPWGEPDRIFLSDGFFMLPEAPAEPAEPGDTDEAPAN